MRMERGDSVVQRRGSVVERRGHDFGRQDSVVRRMDGEAAPGQAGADTPAGTIQSMLDMGERLAWSNSPIAWRPALRMFPAPVMGALLLWQIVPWGLGAYESMPDLTGPFGDLRWIPVMASLPVVLFAAVLVLAPLGSYLRAARTAFGVTDRRAIVLSGLLFRRARSYTPAEIEQVDVRRKKDGSGSVFFRRDPQPWYIDTEDAGRTRATGFKDIPDVTEAAAALRKLAGVDRERGDSAGRW